MLIKTRARVMTTKACVLDNLPYNQSRTKTSNRFQSEQPTYRLYTCPLKIGIRLKISFIFKRIIFR